MDYPDELPKWTTQMDYLNGQPLKNSLLNEFLKCTYLVYFRSKDLNA